MSFIDDDQERWWTAKRDVPGRLTNVMRQIAQRHGGRQMNLRRAARLFGDMPALGLSPREFSQTGNGTFGRLSLNCVRALVCTARADLVQGPAPRPWFVTSGADYDLQKRAEGCTKFTSGVFYQTGFDATARKTALHSANFGDGVVKVFARNNRPCIETVFPWELHVEEADAFYGSPRSLYQTKWVDRSVLKARFPKEANAIEDAKGLDIDASGILMMTQRDPLADQVMVIEAWHLPSGPDEHDGRHVIAVDGAVLHDEEWEEESFPFVRFSWSEPLAGYWSQGIADEVFGIQYEINLTIEKIRQALALCAVPRIFVEKGSKVATSQLNNDLGSIISYVGRPPIFDVAHAVSPELVQHLERLWGKAFQITGVSEMNASSMKPAGLNSGRALRVYADLQSKRFVAWGQAYQDFYVEVARQVVRLMRRIAQDDPEVEVVYHDPKRRRIERIKWSDVHLDEDSYILQAYPVSSLPSTPAGRLAAVDDMLNSGLIDPATAKRLAQVPDLEAEMNLEDAPRDLLEQAFERMIGEGKYVAPEPFYDLALAMKVGALHYQRATMQGVPEERLELLRRFLVATQQLLTPPAPPAPPPGADAPMPPDGGPMPPEMAGAPMMPPAPPGMAA
jgi:hypothetical protein